MLSSIVNGSVLSVPGEGDAKGLLWCHVHSKMAIFDDEYLIMGSANINQRSMDGSRDTEIAVGASEDAHVLGPDGKLPRGQVSGYLPGPCDTPLTVKAAQ